MSIKVTDFKWEKGKNDLEYIELLEKNLDAMMDKFRECSKVAREQYKKGKLDGAREFAKWLCQKSDIAFVNYVDFATTTEESKSIDKVLAEWKKGAENE